MTRAAGSVEEYLAGIDEGRRGEVRRVRDVVRENLPPGYEEGIQYGMIGWYVPHLRYPPGYRCDPSQPLPFGGLAAQKQHLSLYLFATYCDPVARKRFEEEYQATGKRVDLGKSCIRFRRTGDLPLELIAATVASWPIERFVAAYESSIHPSRRGRERRPS